MKIKILIGLIFILCLGTVSKAGTATPIVCPNNNQTGNVANCRQAPVLDFGSQGTGTASMAIAISVNNVSVSTNIPAGGTGTGNLTLSSTPFAISGTNAADFSFTLGGCTANLSISSGGTCSGTITFTPGGAGARTATLTVADDGTTATQTMSLTGNGATVTSQGASACPTALGTGTYQLTADSSCAGTAFTISGTVDIIMNGHTVTYGTGSTASQVGGFLATGNTTATIHGGTITQGGGTNTFRTIASSSAPGSSAIGRSGAGSYQNSSAFFNLAITYSTEFANAIDEVGGGHFIAHDLNITNNAVGTCNAVGCRSGIQSGIIVQTGSSTAPANNEQIYNVTQHGGPQGAIAVTAPGSLVSWNLLYPGNATGTDTQGFSILCWATSCNLHDNITLTPLDSTNNTSRGIQISDAEGHSTTTKNVHDNLIGVFSLANNSEYGGCALAGTFGIQFDDNPPGTNTAQNNTVKASAKNCPAGALRVTDSESVNNKSISGNYSAVRIAGASTCTPSTWSEAKPGCAYGVSFSMSIQGPNPAGFTSLTDTFTADSGDVFVAADGAANVTIQSPIFNKGSNPSGFNTIVTQNGPTSPVSNFHIIDATFNAGTGPTDTSIFAQGPNQGTVSIFIDWTVTPTVSKSTGGPASGAVVTYTDALSHTYTCTTNSLGVCTIPVTQYRNNNDSGANGHENRNTYSRAITGVLGCTYTPVSGISYAATTPESLTMSCSGPPGCQIF